MERYWRFRDVFKGCKESITDIVRIERIVINLFINYNFKLISIFFKFCVHD